VDSYKVESISTMLDDFDNVIGKNFCVYSHYEDFSFASSRSQDKLAEQYSAFSTSNFSGAFQVNNSFSNGVLPKIMFLQGNTKFLYQYKILHYNNEATLIQNAFTFPEFSRHIATAEGKIYSMGGYMPALKLFLKNTFILDEYRTQLVPLTHMKRARADHVVLYLKGSIFVMGGCTDQLSTDRTVESTNHCELYSIERDSWSELPGMVNKRQSFTATFFNDKYIFVFGGRVLAKSGLPLSHAPFDYVNEVEVFDTEKNVWKVLNYIADT
jgi:Kelch motif/Galactose oxidase, central domain